jgi:hypothetical protein
VLQIENYTPFAADRAVLLDKDGRQGLGRRRQGHVPNRS